MANDSVMLMDSQTQGTATLAVPGSGLEIGNSTLQTTLGDPSDIGNRTLATGRTLVQNSRVIISGSNRISLQGTARILVTDYGNSSPTVYLGTPKRPKVSFTIDDGYSLTVYERFTVAGNVRGTLKGDARLVISDDLKTRKRIILSG